MAEPKGESRWGGGGGREGDTYPFSFGPLGFFSYLSDTKILDTTGSQVNIQPEGFNNYLS